MAETIVLLRLLVAVMLMEGGEIMCSPGYSSERYWPFVQIGTEINNIVYRAFDNNDLLQHIYIVVS